MKTMGFHVLLCDTCATAKFITFNRNVAEWTGRCGVLTWRNMLFGGCRGRVTYMFTTKIPGDRTYPDPKELAPLIAPRTVDP